MTNRNFGLEIEISNRNITAMVVVLRAAGFNVWSSQDGSLNDGATMLNTRRTTAESYPAYKTAWRVVYDGSVADGCEVVSPILGGPEGLAEVKRLVKALNKNGAKADARCGLHVHVNAKDLSVVEIQHAARRYAKFENVIDGFVNPRRRGEAANWCKPMAGIVKRIDNSLFSNDENFVKTLNDRYVKLNLLAYLRHGTVEFRQLEGTTSWTKIVNWIQFCVNFVEASRLDKEVVTKVASTADEIRNRLPREILKFLPYPAVHDYDFSYIIGIEERQVPAKIAEFNKKVPGSFTPDPNYKNRWIVKIPITPISFPEVTGNWNDGIPDHVMAHLCIVAKQNAQIAA